MALAQVFFVVWLEDDRSWNFESFSMTLEEMEQRLTDMVKGTSLPEQYFLTHLQVYIVAKEPSTIKQGDKIVLR